MARYRIKFGPGARSVLQNQFVGAAPEDSALQDLTANSTRMTYIHLAPTPRGRRILVYGQNCHAEVGMHGGRLDTFFVFRLRSHPIQVPPNALRLRATFELLEFDHLAELDAVGSVFAAAGAPQAAPTTEPLPAKGKRAKLDGRRRPELSQRLRSVLARGGSELRSVCYPSEHHDEISIDLLRTTWKQLVENVRARPSAAMREDLILAGSIDPRTLGADAILALRTHMESVFFSQTLEQEDLGGERVSALAYEYARSGAASDAGRALIWSAAASALSPMELREELVRVGQACSALAPDHETAWWDAICTEVYDRQKSQTEVSAKDSLALSELLDLLEVADNSEDSYAAELAAWAGRQLAREARASEAPPPTAEEKAHAAIDGSLVPVAHTADLNGPSDQHAKLIEDWTLRQRGMTHKDLEELRADVDSVHRAVSLARAELTKPQGMANLPVVGRALRDFLARRQLLLDEATGESWRSALEDSRQAFDAACANIGAPDVVAKAVAGTAIVGPELVAASQMFELRDTWGLLPTWWWHRLLDSNATEPLAAASSTMDDATVLKLFSVAAARNLTRNACIRLQDLEPALQAAISELRPPPRGTTAADHLAEQLTELSRTVGHAREKYAGSLVPLLDQAKITRQGFLEAATMLDEIEHRLSQETFDSLCEACARQTDTNSVHRLLRASQRALEAIRAFFGPTPGEDRDAMTRDLSWTQLERKTQEALAATGKSNGGAAPSEFTLHFVDVGTVFVDDETKKRVTVPDKPPLFYFAGNEDAPFGHVRIPVVARTMRPRALELAFSVRDDTSQLRTAWPSAADWPSLAIAPQSLRVGEEDWHEEAGSYTAMLSLTLPIRRPGPSDTLSFELVATDKNTAAEVRYTCNWPVIVTDADPADGKPRLAWTWTPYESPDLARAVPVGPQVHVREALERINAGNSLAVTAPRRFGKSSLLALLSEEVATDPDAISIRVDCNTASHGQSRQLDHVLLWDLVSDQLEKQLPGARLGTAFDGRTPPLPTADDFEAVRVLAAARDKERIVVFFDEAQRMFDGGPDYGNRFRALISTHLGREQPGHARVVFCLVGLTTMTRQRLGEDLYPLLRPLSHSELREEQVTKVIRKVIGKDRTLFTTRAARERLARSSWNLYALRTLLMRTRKLVCDEFRLWAGVEDVICAEQRILEELRSGGDPDAINTYIRDSLNAGTSPDDFRPVPAFPIAAAYALARDDNRVGKDAVDSTRLTLREWSSLLFRDHLARPTFDGSVVDKHLNALLDMRVLERANDALGGLRFRSEFLRSYLVGQIQNFLHHDDWFRDALLQAGSRTIRLPPEGEREVLGEGAQARAFLFDREGIRLTARVRAIRNAEEQDAFLENLALLDRIRRIQEGNREGAEGIFKLVDVGLDGSHPPAAVEVYHYIPGVDLRTKVGKLGATMVVKVGLALSRALVLVHSHDVLHRDIRPENVILRDHAFPVLIDFGLACVRSAPGGTPLDDEFTAPEVKGSAPKWSAAADVFALAKTLAALLSPTALTEKMSRELQDALKLFTSADPERRNSAEQLRTRLEALGAQLQIKDREQTIRTKLLDLVVGDPLRAEIAWTVEYGCALQVAGFGLGMYSNERERLCAAAFVVNQVAERFSESVGSYWKRNVPGRWPDGIAAIVTLRNEFVHPRPDGRHYSKRDILDGTQMVSDWIGSRALPTLVAALVDSE